MTKKAVKRVIMDISEWARNYGEDTLTVTRKS